jgi:hypothetical protein
MIKAMSIATQPKPLSVNLYGPLGAPEYPAAERLLKLVEQAIPSTLAGSISVTVDAYLPGEIREQLDIVFQANFPEGLKRKVRLPGTLEEVEITFFDIVAVIEVKNHSGDFVDLASTNAQVFYSRDNEWKSASSQLKQQIVSAKHYLSDQFGWTPWICGLLLFPNLREADLPSTRHDCLAGDSTSEDLLLRLCLQRKGIASHARTHKEASVRTGQEDPDKIQEFHNQLRLRIGGNQRPAPPPPLPGHVVWQGNPPGPHYPRLSLPTALPWQRRQRRRYAWRAAIGWAFTLVLLLSFLLWASISGARFSATKTSITPDLSNPQIHTCGIVTPSCRCSQKQTFLHGTSVYMQFIAKNAIPVSATVRDASGVASPLAFHQGKSLRFGQACFVAKYPIRETAQSGSYAVQISSQNNTTGQQTVIARGFQVAP